MAAEMGAVGGPELEHHHNHHHTGRGWLDVALGVAAVFISLISLFLAIQHGRVMEKMVEASTWAFVTAGFSNANANDFAPHVRLVIQNKGVGPATVQSLEVFYNGLAQPGPHALVRAMLKQGEAVQRPKGFVTSDVVASVISAKEQIDFVDFNVKSFTPEEYEAIARDPKLELHGLLLLGFG
jgi:hypothetical protein